ncbi:Predicted secreted Zn-dependent protease [Pseudoxanthomonas sp. GM95]|uniref:DUF922 domain-containing protein n=1 Tax=Pseudoxanthomonas sp. GM95 TaxID=1881043 RepID=UPI0008D4B94F|nr:DUF922 domain-containing protein [Pseudoxanthomonas sp. GM95]SEL93455.1 Predicted secreted Zn-dependent protease [Pseudoxanthomonas sp. GM95]
MWVKWIAPGVMCMGLSLLIALLVLPMARAGTVSENRKDSTYTVTGRNGREILASMERWSRQAREQIGDKSASEETLAGLTRAQMQMSYQAHRTSESCAVTSATVRVGISVYTPAWEAPPDASLDTRKFWADLHRRVQTHEEQHVTIYRRYAKSVADATERVKAKTCKQVERGVQRLEKQLAAQMEKAHADLDQADGHIRINWKQAEAARSARPKSSRLTVLYAWGLGSVAYAGLALLLWTWLGSTLARARRSVRGFDLQDEALVVVSVMLMALLPPVALILAGPSALTRPALLGFLVVWIASIAPSIVSASRILSHRPRHNP